jgi:hypothetical protein
MVVYLRSGKFSSYRVETVLLPTPQGSACSDCFPTHDTLYRHNVCIDFESVYNPFHLSLSAVVHFAVLRF